MIPPDAAIVAAARGGDSKALAELLRLCQPDLRRFARRTCSTSEDVEDAVQLALWQVYRRIGALRTVAALATWLFRVVERECWRLFHRHEQADPLEGLPESLQPAAPLVPHDLRMDLAGAIDQLSPPYRDVLILRDVHELSAPEVALELALSVEAVKSRLHRARAMVRQTLLASGYWLKDGDPVTGAKAPSQQAEPPA